MTCRGQYAFEVVRIISLDFIINRSALGLAVSKLLVSVCLGGVGLFDDCYVTWGYSTIAVTPSLFIN